ncbi:ATP-binding cassette domain-containing protein [Cyanobacterium stanieri LEGE 03274]|uniref:ATP-binding cassette domain-containing protein n=1 Tax=Cyanobacterium stanieri LEGE 03274 TaxID=1828756 RepID=A0ABR9V6G8_9CHRO|nr:nitrate ABC transporter ATP-binding protein [Cyanobacterium stanieri]MBE9223473.1 ATP-binding cassette domain-containing protein [Cyanobacterium stanieri LEGE 03274]
MQTVTNSQVKLSKEDQAFLNISDVSKVYPTETGEYVVLDGVNLQVKKGEFICLIGHSGCGKSTLLNMVAGFHGPSSGTVTLHDQPITEPGPDRMMVFQNYSLLPWKSAYENIYLAVNTVYADKSDLEKKEIVNHHLEMVGLTEAATKKPGQISGGMKQRVAIARALAIKPEVLILDEPFGALDAITKEELQEELLKIWADYGLTVLMITHDIDEALFLADRIVMMTNGPSAKVGEIMEIPFDRPRIRERVTEDPRYYELRNEAIDFLYNRYAHSEDPQDTEEMDMEEEPVNKGKILGAIAGVVLAGIVGVTMWQSFSSRPASTPATVESVN